MVSIVTYMLNMSLNVVKTEPRKGNFMMQILTLKQKHCHSTVTTHKRRNQINTLFTVLQVDCIFLDCIKQRCQLATIS